MCTNEPTSSFQFTAAPGHLFWSWEHVNSTCTLVCIKINTPRWKSAYCEEVLPFGTIKEAGSTFLNWRVELKPLRRWVWVKKYLFQKLSNKKTQVLHNQDVKVSYLACLFEKENINRCRLHGKKTLLKYQQNIHLHQRATFNNKKLNAHLPFTGFIVSEGKEKQFVVVTFGGPSWGYWSILNE